MLEKSTHQQGKAASIHFVQRKSLVLFSLSLLASHISTALADESTSAHEVFETPPVSVTANPMGLSSDELVAPVSSLGGRELSLQRGSTLGETLSSIPGVSSTNFGPNASRPIIRGLDADRVKIMQNGLGVMDVSALSPDHAVPIDPLVIEQIDVVRGPAALLYGGSAVGGVVNATDNRIPDDKINGIAGRGEVGVGGADHQRHGVAVIDAGNGLFAIHADAYKRESSDLSIPGFARSASLRAKDPQAVEASGRLPNSASSAEGGALGASLTFDHGYLGLAYSAFDSNYGTVAEPNVKIDMHSDRWDLGGEMRDLGDVIQKVKLRLAHTDYQHQELESGVVGTTFTNKGYEGSLEATHGKLGLLSGVVGMQFLHSNFAAIGDESLSPQVLTESKAVYLFEELPLDALKLSFGGRVERADLDSAGAANTGITRFGNAQSRSFTPQSAAFGALYNLNETWAVASNFSHTERAPSYNELFSNGPHPATGQYEVGSTSLGKEKSNGIDLQLRWKHEANTFNVSAFYTRFQNFITLFSTGQLRDLDGTVNNVNGELAEAVVQGVPAIFKGMEAEGKFHVYEGVGHADLKLRADYVHASNADTGEPLPRISPMHLGFGLYYQLNQFGARLDVTHAIKQDHISSNETPTDAYTLVNTTITYRFNTQAEWEVFVKGSNLLNEEIREHASVLKDISPMGGRSLMLGMRTEF